MYTYLQISRAQPKGKKVTQKDTFDGESEERVRVHPGSSHPYEA